MASYFTVSYSDRVEHWVIYHRDPKMPIHDAALLVAVERRTTQ